MLFSSVHSSVHGSMHSIVHISVHNIVVLGGAQLHLLQGVHNVNAARCCPFVNEFRWRTAASVTGCA